MEERIREDNHNKGQTLAGIIIVLIIVALFSFVLYYYLSKQLSETPVISNEIGNESFQPTDNSSVPKESEEEVNLPPETKTTCQNECSQTGQKKCSGNGYQACGNYDADSCLEWSPVVSCPANTVCQNGDCTQQTCSDGTLYGQCSTSKPKYCESGSLINKCFSCGCPTGQQCETTGNCSTFQASCQNECSQAGSKTCSGNGYQTCGNYDADSCLEWSSVIVCSVGTSCQDGDCVSQKCSDGTPYSHCSTTKPQYCDSGTLANKCSVCGCPTGQQCQVDGSCNGQTVIADYYVLGYGGSYTATDSSGNTILADSNAATVINAALSAMKSGQKLAFQGAFSLSATLKPKSNTTLLFGTATFTVDATVSNLITLSSGATGITFDGGFFDAKRNCSYFINGYGYKSITVQNGDYQRFTAAVVSFQQSGSSQDNHLVQYNNFHGATTGTYVDLNFASNCRVLHNTFDGPSGGDHALGVFSDALGNNEIAYNTMIGATGHEIYATTPNMIIHDNELGAGSGDGCLVKTKSFIYNNYVHDRGAWGITLYWREGGTAGGNPAGSRIYNNRIENTLDALVIRPTRGMEPELTVTITDVEYTNNRISGGNGAGFRFIEIGYQVNNVIFRCNTVSNKPYGARIDASGSMIDGIKFLENTFISVPTPFSIGAGTTNTTIAYNDVTRTDASPTNMLRDNGTNTMVYENITTTLLPDKNVPAEKIPPP